MTKAHRTWWLPIFHDNKIQQKIKNNECDAHRAVVVMTYTWLEKVNFGLFKKIKNNYFSCYISFLKFDLFHLLVFCAMADIFLALVDVLIFLGWIFWFLEVDILIVFFGLVKRPLFIGKQWDTHGCKMLTLKFSKTNDFSTKMLWFFLNISQNFGSKFQNLLSPGKNSWRWFINHKFLNYPTYNNERVYSA